MLGITGDVNFKEKQKNAERCTGVQDMEFYINIVL
jgi:hypothetical protein